MKARHLRKNYYLITTERNEHITVELIKVPCFIFFKKYALSCNPGGAIHKNQTMIDAVLKVKLDNPVSFYSQRYLNELERNPVR
jgi:hypothetical protein